MNWSHGYGMNWNHCLLHLPDFVCKDIKKMKKKTVDDDVNDDGY
jgi:hypothetical protein